ncbi:hypothetical protein Dda_3901 [Drechslerella dactyloides]|uniref:Uncharacterized protein n=1 Tax=Drechslerella dactyloides TaxID=74499 RepID=A0AAD6NLJ9_DREDA|nr:hypothetical protein Dda_3901 [Drechslerella dactyloides]
MPSPGTQLPQPSQPRPSPLPRSPFVTPTSPPVLSSSLPTLAQRGISDDRQPNPESPFPLDLANTINTFAPSSSPASHGRPAPTVQETTMIEVQSPVAAPVGIPIKSASHVSLPSAIIEFSRKRSASRDSRKGRSKDSSAPSVAALKILAATAIPLRPSAPKAIVTNTSSTRQRPQRKNSDLSPLSLESSSSLLLEFALSDALDEKSPLFARSNSQTFLNVLLSPPDLSDDYSVAASPPRSVLSIRSLSTESIPSLANDDEGTFSWGPLVTPSPLRRSTKLNKTFSPPEECMLDHPLMAQEPQEPETADEGVDAATLAPEQEGKLSAFSRLSFKSNLTASLRVLRSAARTFTSLSTPLTQPDDFLTRSILSISPQYNTDEKRPKYSDTPTAALRRYLNPSPKTFSRELGQFTDRNESISASIQLQTYKQTIITPPAEVPITRNREVRENCDFLRVIVLEMNMRRQGKLSDTSQGKARFVLPPRQATKVRPLGDRRHWKPITFE